MRFGIVRQSSEHSGAVMLGDIWRSVGCATSSQEWEYLGIARGENGGRRAALGERWWIARDGPLGCRRNTADFVGPFSLE